MDKPPDADVETLNIERYLVNLNYRRQLIWAGQLACEILKGGNVDKTSLPIPGISGANFPLRIFTNLAFEASCINCRAMFEFLGLKHNSNDLVFYTRETKPAVGDDIQIEHFGGTPITPEDIEREIREMGTSVTSKKIVLAFVAANKSVAHFTKTNYPHLDVTTMSVTCHITNKLLADAVRKLGKELSPLPNTAITPPNTVVQ